MIFNTLSQFYNSDTWRNFRAFLISERSNAEGLVIDEYSGNPIVKAYDIIAHHKTPLTLSNVNDYNISLNPENIMLVSMRSHNEIHARFGFCTQRKIYYVYGAPCSGKSSFVNERKGNSDIIADIDNIWQAVTGRERYFKPDALVQCVQMTYKNLLDNIRMKSGNFERAWIIEGGARKAERERKIALLGAEPIYISATKSECISRLENDDRRAPYIKEWSGYIEKWFNEYTE